MNSLEIKAARIRQGISMDRMADVIEKSTVSYAAKERGEIRFTAIECARIARALKLTYQEMNDYLFDGELPLYPEMNVRPVR